MQQGEQPGAAWVVNAALPRDPCANLACRARQRLTDLGFQPLPLSGGGFGAEVREAMDRRVDHLVEEGLARRQGQRVIFARDLIDTLGRRDLE